MAKGNMFQGMARGKVGDVVFSRLDGEQVSRVRNRHPQNPKTNAQLVQRAIMATVMQMYSKGKAIFDHSFQGEKVGSGCQRMFMSLNADKLRAAVAYDLRPEGAVLDDAARVVGPRVKYATANPYILSAGTYDNVVTDNEMKFLVTPEADEKLATYCSRVGLLAGDYYTLILLHLDDQETVFEVAGESSDQAKQFLSEFGFIRMKVKASATTDTETVITTNTTLSKIFEVDDYAGTMDTNISSCKISEGLVNGQGAVLWDAGIICYGVIRSRKDQDLRSNSELTVPEEAMGITSHYILDAWKQGTAQIGDSDLILEGGQGF